MAVAYRADIDGLRAAAIVPVVLFHAFPSLVPGGFVGVDVFFVVSGWLIGGIVFAQLAQGRFAPVEFWARRALRLLPALVMVLGCVLAAGWLLLLPDEWRLLGRHVRAGATYLANFALARESGYFDTAAEAKPLLHLWSLAIEEQFYLAFPLLALTWARWPRWADSAWAVKLLAGLLVASFGYGMLDSARNPAAGYFLPQSRVWELLVGVLLARLGTPRPPAAGLASAAGLAAILGAAFLFDRDMTYPGWRALVPVLGTALVIAAGPAAWANRVLLARRWPVAVGLVSYPLYLWHWPLLSLARIVEGGEVAVPVRVALLAAAGLLAVATWRWVERPVRFGALPRGRTAAALAGLCFALALGGQAVLGGALPAYASRFPGIDAMLAAAGDWDYPGALERLPAGGRVQYRQAGTGAPVLFLGDSNIEQYAPRMVALLRDAPATHRTALFLTGGGCVPIPGLHDPRLPGCASLWPAAEAAIATHGVATVVIGGQWWGYFTSPRILAGGTPLTDPAGRQAALGALSAAIAGQVRYGRRVVLVLNIPWSAELDPRQGVARGWWHFATRRNAVTRARLDAAYGDISRAIAATALSAGAEVIDPLRHLCDSTACPAMTPDGAPIYKDAVHLRASFVRSSVTYLDHVLAR